MILDMRTQLTQLRTQFETNYVHRFRLCFHTVARVWTQLTQFEHHLRMRARVCVTCKKLCQLCQLCPSSCFYCFFYGHSWGKTMSSTMSRLSNRGERHESRSNPAIQQSAHAECVSLSRIRSLSSGKGSVLCQADQHHRPADRMAMVSRHQWAACVSRAAGRAAAGIRQLTFTASSAARSIRARGSSLNMAGSGLGARGFWLVTGLRFGVSLSLVRCSMMVRDFRMLFRGFLCVAGSSLATSGVVRHG